VPFYSFFFFFFFSFDPAFRVGQLRAASEIDDLPASRDA